MLEQQVQAIVNQFLAGLAEQDLEKTFARVRSGREHVVSVRNMLWHLVEEELQHRGELNALLWQIDVDAPIFDWNAWVELQKNSKK